MQQNAFDIENFPRSFGRGDFFGEKDGLLSGKVGKELRIETINCLYK